MDQKSFGEFIANLRREAELTQRQVANTLHVTDRAVSKWERGLCYPDVTLLEPLATTLRVNVEDLLTCQRRISPVQGNELEALQSVLEISQGESRMRARRTRLWAFIGVAVLLILAILITLQHNGALLHRQRTTSPDGSTILTVYRDQLLDGNFHIMANHPLHMEGIRCSSCGQQQARWLHHVQLDDGLSSVDELLWSANSRYLLISGTTGYRSAPTYLALWDWGQSETEETIHAKNIHLSILQQLSGYDAYYEYTVEDKPLPVESPEPMLPALPGNGWMPSVTLSDVHWDGSSHQLTMLFAYDGTDNMPHHGELVYDADTDVVLSAIEATPMTRLEGAD